MRMAPEAHKFEYLVQSCLERIRTYDLLGESASLEVGFEVSKANNIAQLAPSLPHGGCLKV